MTSRSPFLTQLATGRVGKIPELLLVCHFERSEKSKIPHIRSDENDTVTAEATNKEIHPR